VKLEKNVSDIYKMLEQIHGDDAIRTQVFVWVERLQDESDDADTE
jgi:hypothetical protein